MKNVSANWNNSFISTIPWLPFIAPTQCHFSLTYLQLASTWGVRSTHLVSLLGHAPAPCPLPVPPPSDWLRLFLSQTFSRINNPTISPPLYTMGIRCNVGERPILPHPGAAASPKRLEKVAYPQCATEPVWTQNPDSQPSKVYPSHN